MVAASAYASCVRVIVSSQPNWVDCCTADLGRKLANPIRHLSGLMLCLYMQSIAAIGHQQSLQQTAFLCLLSHLQFLSDCSLVTATEPCWQAAVT